MLYIVVAAPEPPFSAPTQPAGQKKKVEGTSRIGAHSETGGCGERGSLAARLMFLSSPLAAARVEARLEGLLLLLALAGPACELKNALLRRRLG